MYFAETLEEFKEILKEYKIAIYDFYCYNEYPIAFSITVDLIDDKVMFNVNCPLYQYRIGVCDLDLFSAYIEDELSTDEFYYKLKWYDLDYNQININSIPSEAILDNINDFEEYKSELKEIYGIIKNVLNDK